MKRILRSDQLPSGQNGSILPSSLFGHIINLLLTETSSWSIKITKKNLANIQPHAWSITHIQQTNSHVRVNHKMNYIRKQRSYLHNRTFTNSAFFKQPFSNPATNELNNAIKCKIYQRLISLSLHTKFASTHKRQIALRRLHWEVQLEQQSMKQYHKVDQKCGRLFLLSNASIAFIGFIESKLHHSIIIL